MLKRKQFLNEISIRRKICSPRMGGGGEGHKGPSFCGTPAKKLQNLRPVESYIKILRLRHHQESQVAIKIDSRP